MKPATPPNGVTARCVSRRINRSSDNRAVISRGTGLSVAFDSISLLSQILGPHLTPNFGFPDEFCHGELVAQGHAVFAGTCGLLRTRPKLPQVFRKPRGSP